jgi:putative inorganic carbon (HCO3(-)) transporter
MFPRHTANHSFWYLIGYGLLATGLGGGVGFLLVWLDNPLLAVAGAVGVLAGIVMALNVDLGLLSLIFITFTRFSDILVNEHGLPSIAKPFILLLAVGIAVRWIFYSRPPRGWGTAFLLIGAYGMVAFLSLTYARDYTRSYDAVSDFLKDGAIAIMIVMILQNDKIFRNVAWTMVATGAFLGTISVYQYITGSYSNNFWGFGQAAMSNIAGSTESYRIAGPFYDPNAYAQLMVVFVPLALDRFMSARNNASRIVAVWAVVVASLTVVVTFSRGGFLSLAVALGIYAIWKGLSIRNWMLILTLVLIIFSFMPAQYTERLVTLGSFLPGNKSSQQDISFVGRMSENIIGMRMFFDHPFLGVGIKNYPVYYIDYSRGLGLDQRRTERSPHSLYLEVAAEQGLLGIMVFGALLYGALHGLVFAKRVFHQLYAYEMENMAMSFLIGFIGYLTSAIFLHGAYPRPFWVLIGLSFAFSAHAKNLLEQENN